MERAAVADNDYRESLRDFKGLKTKIIDISEAVGIKALKKQLIELEKEAAQENFWQDKDRFPVVNQEISRLNKKINPWDHLVSRVDESIELFDMALEENDETILDEICLKLDQLKTDFDRLETIELLSGEDDLNNAFVTIHPGAGGTESQDWASMLFKMYCRWGEKKGFSLEIMDYTQGDEAGIKSATVLIKGEYSYGLMKCERGIHRLVRISPFDANKRRHTSFASVEVMPEISEEIDVEVLDIDLKIDTFRASGAGGQHVNTTDSAVRITHLPTGIVVQCQNERSQHKNKAFAMKMLRSKIYTQRRKEHDEKKLEKAGQKADISWGNQIRSYVLQPYTLIKDHRTDQETGNIDAVFDGSIDLFIYSYLKSLKKKSD